jgi:hypothetical protein
MSTTRFLALCIALLLSFSTQASPRTEALGRCLADNTTGKDRKDLARWIFIAMSAHPEIGSVAKASVKDGENAQRAAGALFTRLIADQCTKQLNSVMQSEGSDGIKIAFEHLGRMAMQELMAAPEVNASLTGFDRYIDKERIERAIKMK